MDGDVAFLVFANIRNTPVSEHRGRRFLDKFVLSEDESNPPSRLSVIAEAQLQRLVSPPLGVLVLADKGTGAALSFDLPSKRPSVIQMLERVEDWWYLSLPSIEDFPIEDIPRGVQCFLLHSPWQIFARPLILLDASSSGQLRSAFSSRIICMISRMNNGELTYGTQEIS